MLLEWGSCKRGVDKIIRTRIAFVEGAVQPLRDRCGGFVVVDEDIAQN